MGYGQTGTPGPEWALMSRRGLSRSRITDRDRAVLTLWHSRSVRKEDLLTTCAVRPPHQCLRGTIGGTVSCVCGWGPDGSKQRGIFVRSRPVLALAREPAPRTVG